MVKQTSGVLMRTIDLMRPRGERVIDGLRRQMPGVWTYDRQMNTWRHESGVEVRATAELVDEDRYVTDYRRTDNGARVDPFWGSGL